MGQQVLALGGQEGVGHRPVHPVDHGGSGDPGVAGVAVVIPQFQHEGGGGLLGFVDGVAVLVGFVGFHLGALGVLHGDGGGGDVQTVGAQAVLVGLVVYAGVPG